MQFLIDANGVEWDINQPWLYQHLRFRGSARDLTNFAVRNLGFVSTTREKNYFKIKLRPDYLPIRAFEKVADLLAKLAPTRIIIERDLKVPEFVDILTDPSDAIARLSELTGPALPGPGTKFFADVMSLDRLKTSSETSLTIAYRQWRQQRGQLTKRAVRSLFDDPLSAPWLVGRLEGDDGLVTRTAPEYVAFWGEGSREGLIGKPMAEHPDKDFGKAAEKSYLSVHRTEAPAIELVTTIVRRPAGPLHWGRYERLILPWRLSDGSMLLSSVSAVRIARDLASPASM